MALLVYTVIGDKVLKFTRYIVVSMKPMETIFCLAVVFLMNAQKIKRSSIEINRKTSTFKM